MNALLIRAWPSKQPVQASIDCIDRLLTKYAVGRTAPLSEVGRVVLGEHIDRALDERLRLMERVGAR